ncbi:nucleotidyltransferase family protein [Candidatus Aerophobetes bacterium]|nr:nucleotidyltransferase family protein [Candidatus Aerophobetes bacterium]
MRTVEEIKKILINLKPEIQKKYKVKKLGIFGSYIKNQQKRGSDIDILVEYSEVPDLIDFIELQSYLSNLLGIKVDLVMKSSLKPNIRRGILREVIYL